MEPSPGTYARRLSKATTAAAAARVGQKMLKKFNIENTNAWVTMNAKLEAHKLCTRDPIIGPGRQAASSKPQATSRKPQASQLLI